MNRKAKGSDIPEPKTLVEEGVHVVLVGWEYDRIKATIPRLPARKVYFIVCSEKCGPEAVSSNHFRKELEKSLMDLGYKMEVTYINHPYSLWEFSRKLIDIIGREKEKKVYINISACIRLWAIMAAEIAAYYPEQVELYYTIPDTYLYTRIVDGKGRIGEFAKKHGLSKGIRGIMRVPIVSRGLTKREAEVLKYLALSEGGVESLIDVKKKLDMPYSYIAYVISQLEAKGYVTVDRTSKFTAVNATLAGQIALLLPLKNGDSEKK
jgi:hypothetical protein